MISRNERAFLDLIAWSEIGPQLLALTDDGYNVLVGSTPRRPKIFLSYKRHPQIRDERMNSDAAGRYQFMGRYWDHYRKLLYLPDFGPDSQDRWALHLVKECGALDEVQEGEIMKAVILCKSRWASFPGAGYGQHENQMVALLNEYQQAGGRLA